MDAEVIRTGSPPTDEFRSWGEHLDELIRRMMGPVAIIGICFLLFFTISETLIDGLVDHLELKELDDPDDVTVDPITGEDIDPQERKLKVYRPTELLTVKIKLSMALAMGVGLPFVLYQGYLFAAPGLYHQERRFALWVIPSSLTLFIIGSGLALIYLAPRLMELMLTNADGGPVEVALSLERTLTPIFTLVFGLGLAFQLPLIIGLGLKLQLFTYEQLTGKRPYLYGLLILLSIILAPDPSLMAQLVILAVMLLILELTLGVARLTQKMPASRA